MAESAAILTIEAASPGGVPALVETVYGLMEQWGFAPTVYRTHFAAGRLSFWQRVLITFQYWKPQAVEEHSHPTVLVPAPPFPLWLFYAVPHFLVGELLGQYDAVFVASGSAHVALPLALRRMSYVLWIATLYEDELRAKANVGDEWAQRTLARFTWGLLKLQERFVIQRAHHILALSPHTARRIQEHYPGAADRVETVLYPIDLMRFCPDPQVRQASPYGAYLLLAARINDPRKNVPLLLKAFKLVHERYPELRLVLTGETPNQSLLNLTNDLELTNSVIFRGIVSSDELLQLYQAAQLFVLTSAQEGLGIVMLEAMACGTPVVTTASGGPEGLVINGLSGYIVQDSHNPDALASAIIDLLDDPDQMEMMRQRCAKFAREHYAFPIVAAQLHNAFASTLAAAQAPSRWRIALAAGWTILILTAYLQRQLISHWPSIQMRLLDPLLSWLP